MDTLFTLKNGEITIHSSMLANKAFRDLIRRDRGGMMEGDSQGVKKFRAIAEIGLIWYLVNLNSPGLQGGHEGDDLEARGKKFFGLPDDWKPDTVFYVALEEYKAFYSDSVVVKSIRNILEGLSQTHEMTNVINKFIKTKLKTGELAPDEIGELIRMNKELSNVAGNLPDTVKQLKNLELSYLREEATNKKARGGHTITASMMPGN